MTKLSARPGPAGESSEQDIFSHGGSHKATFAIRRPLISPGSSSSKAKQQAETRIPEEDVKEPHRQFNISPTPPIRAADDPITYARPFVSFLRENPTVYHAVQATKDRLIALTTSSTKSSFTVLSERNHPWDLTPGGSYLVTRNGSSLIAFTVGKYYKPGNGIAIIAGHIDALTAKVKPFPKLNSNGKDGTGFERLGVAPYAGALNKTWWDRDLGIAGRVMLKDRSRGGKVVQRLVDLGDPIARIPTLAPHFGQISQGPYNLETQMVPIVGLETGDSDKALGDEGTFAATQPPRLVRAISKSLGTTDYNSILNWDLELYDTQPAQLGGFDKEFIYGGRLDDKLCSWAATEALVASNQPSETINLVALFDDEEIGSLLRQGARANFLPTIVQRITQGFPKFGPAPPVGQTYANSFMVSADVTHAVNPNFLKAYMPNHAPKLNVGVAISADSNGHMTTDAVSTAFLQRVAEECGSKLQTFEIRNDVRSGGTVGPMLSSATGVRAIDVGIPQLSMHSIRATMGSLDPGLGVQLFKSFFDHFEEIDNEFRED